MLMAVGMTIRVCMPLVFDSNDGSPGTAWRFTLAMEISERSGSSPVI